MSGPWHLPPQSGPVQQRAHLCTLDGQMHISVQVAFISLIVHLIASCMQTLASVSSMDQIHGQSSKTGLLVLSFKSNIHPKLSLQLAQLKLLQFQQG